MLALIDFPRADAATLREIAKLPTGTLHEAQGQTGAMPGFIKPIYQGMKVCGSALTIDCPPGDNLTIHAAVEHAKPGDVLVVDFKGFAEAGPFGDVLGTACEARGIVGLVIDGSARDGLTLKEMGFPVFARGLNMKAASKKVMGRIGVPIICAGVAVEPGDVVVGDDDGVVVIPRARALDVLKASIAREDREAELRDILRQGQTTIDLLNLRGLIGPT